MPYGQPTDARKAGIGKSGAPLSAYLFKRRNSSRGCQCRCLMRDWTRARNRSGLGAARGRKRWRNWLQ
ncbi:hypothetical protein [Lysobacter gummosus]|uniref:hypothetical protein n=1 Tax=Lysobacter gummosus TaxID=262324 RepID=UPI0036368DA4